MGEPKLGSTALLVRVVSVTLLTSGLFRVGLIEELESDFIERASISEATEVLNGLESFTWRLK